MFQQVKTLVSSKSACETYNIKLDRKGFTLCLFHADSKPSMKVYDGTRGFYCFSCGAKGDVIDLVGKIFNIKQKQSLIRLSNDFNLGLTQEKPDKRQLKKLQEKRKIQEEVERIIKVAQYNHDLEVRNTFLKFHELKPKQKFEELSDEFIQVMLKLNKLELEV
jgi:DNA primase